MCCKEYDTLLMFLFFLHMHNLFQTVNVTNIYSTGTHLCNHISRNTRWLRHVDLNKNASYLELALVSVAFCSLSVPNQSQSPYQSYTYQLQLSQPGYSNHVRAHLSEPYLSVLEFSETISEPPLSEPYLSDLEL